MFKLSCCIGTHKGFPVCSPCHLQSYDTVGNGFFSLFMHALPAGWR